MFFNRSTLQFNLRYLNMSIIQSVKPKARNPITDVSVEIKNNETMSELVFQFAGTAVDGYSDTHRRKATCKELSDFFDSVYYGDKHVSVCLRVVDVLEHFQSESEFVLVLEKHKSVNAVVKYSNDYVFVSLSEFGFKNVPDSKLNDYIGIKKFIGE